jgi:hypothetical protein
MSLFSKISAMISLGTALEAGIGKAIGDFAIGDVKDGVTALLAAVETESNSHPAVVAELVKIQTVLANAGLAVAPVAGATTVIPGTTPAVVVAAPPVAEAAAS